MGNEIPHRKNAAEWVMFAALYPLDLILRAWMRTTAKRSTGEADRAKESAANAHSDLRTQDSELNS